MNLVVKERGFTVVELLVTVAIIGILAATAVANFKDYKARAYTSKAISLQRQMIAGAENLLADLDETAHGSISYLTWFHMANGSGDTHVAGDDRMKDYIALSDDPGVFFLFWLNPIAAYSNSGAEYTYFYANVGHCDGPVNSEGNVRYNTHTKRVVGKGSTSHYFVPKPPRGCIE